MKRVEYPIKGMDLKSVVMETKRQRDILDTIDELLENAEEFGWDYIFADNSIRIEYTDGSVYEANGCTNEGQYKKKGIERIIYENSYDTQVYGKYTVNEYGIVQ